MRRPDRNSAWLSIPIIMLVITSSAATCRLSKERRLTEKAVKVAVSCEAGYSKCVDLLQQCTNMNNMGGMK